MALELKEEYFDETYLYSDPSIYNVNECDVEEFDKDFPYKEKKVLPTQIF